MRKVPVYTLFDASQRREDALVPFMLEIKRPKTEERQRKEEAVTADCVNTVNHGSVHET